MVEYEQKSSDEISLSFSLLSPSTFSLAIHTYTKRLFSLLNQDIFFLNTDMKIVYQLNIPFQ